MIKLHQRNEAYITYHLQLNQVFFCVVAFRIPSFCYTNYLKYVYFFLCSYFCGQSAYAVTIDILKDLLVFKITEKHWIYYHFFISYVLRGNTVFAKTF